MSLRVFLLSSQWCSDAIHSGCDLAGLSRRDRRLRPSEQGRHHGQILDVKLSEPVAFVTVVVYFLGMLSGWTVVAFVRGSFRRITEHPRH